MRDERNRRWRVCSRCFVPGSTWRRTSLSSGLVDPDAREAGEQAGVTALPRLGFCTYDVEVTGAREIADYCTDGWHPV